jgi:hypothetical protein
MNNLNEKLSGNYNLANCMLRGQWSSISSSKQVVVEVPSSKTKKLETLKDLIKAE